MSRQVIDGVILVAVLALCATHLYAQGMGGKRVLLPSQPAVAQAAAPCVGPPDAPGAALAGGAAPRPAAQRP